MKKAKNMWDKMITTVIHLVVGVKGYSLYSRLVSSIFVWTPFPRGTCTPSKVTAAPGSGAVRPKPAGKTKELTFEEEPKEKV